MVFISAVYFSQFEKLQQHLSIYRFVWVSGLELVIERPDSSKRYYNHASLVTGHTPAVNIDEEYRGRIYKANGHIAIDCGAGFDMPLSCIRLDDFKEFYIE